MGIYRKCQLAEIALPLMNGSTILDVSLEDNTCSSQENEMDTNESEEIELDFKKLKKEYKSVI